MLSTPSQNIDSLMTTSDRALYEHLGQRIAEHRKARGITQVQLAEQLGVAQQTMAHYEGVTLANVATALDTTMEDLIGSTSTKTNNKRGPAPKIQQQLERVAALPKARQRLISEVLDSMLAQASR